MVTGIEQRNELMDIADGLKRKIWAAETFTWEEVEYALSRVTEAEDRGLYGMVCYYAAFYMIYNGRLEECLSYLHESIRCIRGTEQEVNLCRCYHMLGMVAQTQNNLVLAMEHYEKARIYARQNHLHFIYCLTVGNMANVYASLGVYDRAVIEYQEFVREMKKLGRLSNHQENMYCKMLAGYGYSLIRMNRMEEAIAVAEELKERMQDMVGLAAVELNVYVFWAFLAYQNGDREQADFYTEYAVAVVMGNNGIVADYDVILKLFRFLVSAEKYEQLKSVLEKMEPQAIEARNEGFLLQLLLYRLQYCSQYMSEAELLENSQNFFRLQSKHEYAENNQVLRMMNMRNRLREIEEEQTKLMEENIRLIYQTQHDNLSGLYNKRYLNRHMEEMFEEAMQKELPLGVMFLDIDYFKQMNDRYGHQKGDECIVAIAESVNSCLQGEFVARYGGDEFVIITLGRTKEYMKECAQRLVDHVREKKIPNADAPGEGIVTITLGGVCAIPHKPNRMWDFLATADEVLYQQKNEKRGCARFYSGDGDSL